MIKLRLAISADQEKRREIPVKKGETLDDAVRRSLEGVPLPSKEAYRDIFQAVLNGNIIESKYWGLTRLAESDDILIAPRLQDSATASSAFRAALTLGIGLGAMALFGPGGAYVLSGFAYSAAVAATSVIGSLIVNALIPPPDFSSPAASPAQSQMYSITGQSNRVNRMGTVPKVYGTHRIYPYIAANPYTEIEADPATGELVQYLYAVYDFGLGPAVISDIRIGDTPISNFSDFSYRLVDFNKPAVPEGEWDSALFSGLAFYKGDNSSEQVAVTLDGNQVDGDSVATYQATRLTPENATGLENEITLTFTNPNGLYSLASNGSFGSATINLDIEFRKVGETTWRGWNDETWVSQFKGVGGDSVYKSYTILAPPHPVSSDGTYSGTGVSNGYWGQIGSDYYAEAVRVNGGTYPAAYADGPGYGRVLGYKAGANRIIAPTGAAPNGGRLLYDGRLVGYIKAVTGARTQLSGEFSGYEIVELSGALTEDIPLFQFIYAPLVAKTLNGGYLYPVGTYYKSPVTLLSDRLTGNITPTKKARISRQNTAPCYSTFKFTPKVKGQFQVRVTRTSTTSQFNSQVIDTLSWVTLSSRFDSVPIVTDQRHVFMDLKIRATNQLNGSISNLSATVSSVLDVYNGSTWVKQVTSNPAWVFADLLTGAVNKRALDKSRLDVSSLIGWSNFCDVVPDGPPDQVFSRPRVSCDFVLDYPSTLQQVVNQVTSSGRASLNIIDGKYGVLVDELSEIPVQIFTPRNSRNFSSTRVYSIRPHALRVQYIEPTLSWETAEAIVYEDGYDETTAETFEDIVAFACTSYEQAWRYGRFMLAQNRLRQETITLDVDFEYLVCTRGDFVQITQDVMKVGGTPARVKSVDGNRVVIDDALEIGPIDYGFTFRSSANSGIYTSTCTPVSSDTFDLDGSDLPEVGDLIVIGEVDKVTFDCIVKSISPNSDNSATLTLIERAVGVYEAESTTTIPPYDPQINVTTNPDFAPPAAVEDLVVADNFWECADSGYQYYVELDWDAPSGSAFEAFQIYVDSGLGFNIAGTTRESYFKYIVDPTRLDLAHEFKVVAVSATGKKLDLASVPSVSATPVTKTTRPSNVEFLATDITNEVLQLSWTQIADCDCREYLIRYSPLLDATWETTIPLCRVDRNTTSTSVQARTGTYLIKAVDFNYNESAEVARATTTIPNLFGLNIISEVTDFPDLEGTTDRVVATDGTLILAEEVSGGAGDAEYYPEGFYYYQDLLDLGDIYTVRLQSLIQAEGYTVDDIMSNWVTLSSVSQMSNARTSEWDVEAQYRTTSNLNLMSEWATLSAVDPIGGGSDDSFSPWRKFIQSDATGRIFQFRLRLISNKLSVSPRVFDGTIRADMPDRFETYNNIVVPVGGYDLEYDPAFKGPGTTPNIQVSIDGAEAGDRPEITSRTLEGFSIRILDINGDPVERQVDIAVKGYGRRAEEII